MLLSIAELEVAKKHLSEVKPCLYSAKQEYNLDVLKATQIILSHSNNLKQEFVEAQYLTPERWEEGSDFKSPVNRQDWINESLQNYYE